MMIFFLNNLITSRKCLDLQWLSADMRLFEFYESHYGGDLIFVLFVLFSCQITLKISGLTTNGLSIVKRKVSEER